MFLAFCPSKTCKRLLSGALVPDCDLLSSKMSRAPASLEWVAERPCTCDISVEGKRGETTAVDSKGMTCGGASHHITLTGDVKSRHLTFAVKERTFTLVYLAGVFSWVHSLFCYKQWMLLFGVFFFLLSDFFHEQTARISSGCGRSHVHQHHDSLWWAARHCQEEWCTCTLTPQPIKIDASSIGSVQHIRVVNISCGSSRAWSYAPFWRFNGGFACCL